MINNPTTNHPMIEIRLVGTWPSENKTNISCVTTLYISNDIIYNIQDSNSNSNIYGQLPWASKYLNNKTSIYTKH